jgi:hypothetical protein
MTKRQVVTDLIIIFLLGLVVLLWYPGKDFLVVGHDVGYPLNPLNFFKDLFFVWTQNIGLGTERATGPSAILIHSIEVIFSWLSGSIYWGQRLVFIFWFILPGFFMYAWVYSIPTFKKYRFMPLIASIFYMFNHFQIQGWGVAWRTRFSVYAVLPLTFLIMEQCLDKKRGILQSGFLLAISLFFLNAGGGFGLPLFGSLIISSGLFCIYLTLLEWQKSGIGALKRSLYLVSLTLFLLIIFNFYWILPFFHYTFANYSQKLASAGGGSGVLPWIEVISKDTSFINLFRLQGFSSWYDNLKHPYSNLFLNDPILIFSSFFWSLLAFAGILLAREKERKQVFFFPFLILVAMVFAAGSHPPSGILYEAFVKYIPFFAVFRTPFYKFGSAVWFAYAFLISFTANKLFEKFNRRWIYNILSGIFIIFILLYSYPFFTGSFFNWNLPLTTMVKIPDYVFNFGKWADSLKSDERILMLPPLNANWGADTYNWNYWSLSTLPTLLTRKSVITNSNGLGKREKILINALYDSLWQKNESISKELISILNIKYFLLRKDFFYNLDWCPSASPTGWQTQVGDLNWIKPEHEFGEWIVYRLEINELLTHFYIPKEFTYIQGDTSALVDIISLKNGGDEGGFYLTNEAASLGNVGNSELVFVIGQLEKCLLEERIIKLPEIRFFPDSLFYPLVEWKERRWEKKIRSFNDPDQTINLDLGLATKRLAEVEKLLLEEDEKRDGETIAWIVKKSMQDYQTRFEEISYLVGEIMKDGRDINNVLLLIGDYFRKYEDVFNEVRGKSINIDMRIRFENAIWGLEDFLDRNKSQKCTSEDRVRKYTINIPRGAEYELFVENERFTNYYLQDPLSPIVFKLDGELATKSGEVQNNDWILADKIELNQGEHHLAVILPEVKNLVEKEDLYFGQEGEKRKMISLPINNFDDTGLYKISFSYKPSDEYKAKFVVSQDTDKKNEELGGYKHSLDAVLSDRLLPEVYEAYFRPDSGAKQAALEFTFEVSKRGGDTLEVKNIKVERIWTPTIILKIVNAEAKKVQVAQKIPQIVYRRINPTKYEVEVKEAKEPYTLVFLESFHPAWEAKIVDGFSSKPIPEARHIMANGYANSWSILPADSGGQENYKMTIEYWPQKLLYMGIIISGLGFIGCFGCGSWFLIRRRKQRRKM